MKYLITGVAGFIGSCVTERLCATGHLVIGIDNLNDYYDVSLKEARLKRIKHSKFSFVKMDIADRDLMADLFAKEQFDRVIHFAGQAGVRYSIDNPMAYGDSNLIGFLNLLEGCRHNQVGHFIYASSSSVYGLNRKIPFDTSDSVDHPVSLYAATKKSNELMAHSYSHLYDMPTTGLRFFTVYGPWSRPDMAMLKFAQKIIKGEPIDIYNNGNMYRDFTYIDDIVEGVIRIQDVVPSRNAEWTVEEGKTSQSSAPYRVYNIGNGNSLNLMDYVEALEDELGVEAIKNMMPMQPGDVYQTYADSNDLFEATGFKPQRNLKEGVKEFVHWFKSYYM